jgi:hypothetical protein
MAITEVRIFGAADVPDGTNLAAAYGIATQSSTAPYVVCCGLPSPGPQKAIDGNTNSDYFGGSVNHTDPSVAEAPFIDVDLGSVFAVDSIVVHNRTDSDTAGVLRNVIVEILDENHDVVAQSTLLNENNELNGPLTLSFDPAGSVLGKFVRVRKTDNPSFLHVAEIEVFGSAVPEPSTIGLLTLGALSIAAARRRVR